MRNKGNQANQTPYPVATGGRGKKRLNLWMIAVTVVTVLAIWLWPGEKVVGVRVQQVQVRAIEQKVEASAQVARVGEYLASSPAGGTIAEVYVQAGQQVRAGQALLRLDTQALEEALMDAARASREKRALWDEYAQTAWRSGLADLDAYQQTQDDLALSQLSRQIAAATLRAHADGEVLQVLARTGEALLPGAPAMMLGAQDSLVRAQVGERESLSLSNGLRARISRDGVPLGEGAVTSVGLPTTRADGVLNCAVEILPDQPLGFPPGARVDVEIVVKTQENAVLVPVEALDEDSLEVWRVIDGRAYRRPVFAGLEDAVYVSVVGIPRDALVVLDPPEGLTDGQRVKVVDAYADF